MSLITAKRITGAGWNDYLNFPPSGSGRVIYRCRIIVPGTVSLGVAGQLSVLVGVTDTSGNNPAGLTTGEEGDEDDSAYVFNAVDVQVPAATSNGVITTSTETFEGGLRTANQIIRVNLNVAPATGAVLVTLVSALEPLT